MSGTAELLDGTLTGGGRGATGGVRGAKGGCAVSVVIVGGGGGKR